MGKTVIHLEKEGQHYYFGSLKAIYLHFTKEDIGITYGSLKNYALSSNKPYLNNKVILRKGTLLTTGDTKQKTE